MAPARIPSKEIIKEYIDNSAYHKLVKHFIDEYWGFVTEHESLVAENNALKAQLKNSAKSNPKANASSTPRQNNDVQRVITEYSLPATVQTHEIVAPNGRDDLLLISQQESNGLVKIKLNPSDGSLISAAKSTVRGRDKRYNGAHGLHASTLHRGQVWLTLQFSDELLRIDPDSLEVRSQFKLPAPLRGPHSVFEDGEFLWVGCKDSGHIARLNQNSPQDRPLVHQCSPRPNLVVKTNTHVYASLDQSSLIFCLELRSNKPRELHIPPNRGSTPVGIIPQPDGKAAWFVLLGAPGTFGCISGEKISYYKLSSPMASTAGLIHLAFDRDPHPAIPASNIKLWLLASSLAKASGGGHDHHGAGGPPKEINGIDALITVVLEPSTMTCTCGDECKCDPCDCNNPMRIVSEDMVTLPTQSSLTHRVLCHGSGSVFVTELGVSSLARISGSVLQGSHDSRKDNYALWGHGVCNDHVDYVV